MTAEVFFRNLPSRAADVALARTHPVPSSRFTPTSVCGILFGMRTVIGVAGLCAVCGLAYGQNAASAPSPALTFEVASVKPAPPPDGRGRTVRATGIPGVPFMKDPGRFTAENFSLANLITLAYDIPHYRLSAAPELNLVMFNIVATMPVDTTKEQFKAMLQNLLAERFGLKVHWERRQMETYELLLAKSGPKLKDAVADASSGAGDAPPRPAGSSGRLHEGPTDFRSHRRVINLGWPSRTVRLRCVDTMRLRPRWRPSFPIKSVIR